MKIKRGILFFNKKNSAIRFKGLAQSIFQFGAVMGCAVNPPKKTMRQPNIPVKRNKIKVSVLSRILFLSLQSANMSNAAPAAKINSGFRYQGLLISGLGA